MSPIAFASKRSRTILDCSLILLLILILISSSRSTPATARSQALPGGVFSLETASLSRADDASPGPGSTDPPAQLAPVDDNLLAAMIAAENAALSVLNSILVYLPEIAR